MKILVTGASGYIGTRLVSAALGREHDVVSAARIKRSNFASRCIQFELSNAQSFCMPDGVDVVVHLAAFTSHFAPGNDSLEVAAARELAAQASRIGAKFIFVSSQSARPDAPTPYGRTKWRIEQDVLATGGWVIRPGQVYGGDPRGLFGSMIELVRKLPVLPAFLPVPKVQPIHVDDLVKGILHVIERENIPPAVYCLASNDSISFSKFLAAIAKTRLRVWRGFFPVPSLAVNAFSFALSESWRARLGLVRLRSLFDLPMMHTSADLKLLGIALRPLGSGMHRSGSDVRRRLLQEGHALLVYVLRVQPGIALMGRYVRAVEQIRGRHALILPSVFLNFPSSLSLLGRFSWPDRAMEMEYLWRLNATTLLAEASPVGACRFLGLGQKSGALRSFTAIVLAVGSDLIWRAAAMLLSPMLRLAMTPKRGEV